MRPRQVAACGIAADGRCMGSTPAAVRRLLQAVRGAAMERSRLWEGYLSASGARRLKTCACSG